MSDSAKTGYVYYSEETHKMEPELLKTWEAFADKYEKTGTIMKNRFGKRQRLPNTVSVHFLGISESVFDKLEWRGEKCSWDTFKSGNYVLVDYGNKYAERPVSYYQTGGIFQMVLNKKGTKMLPKKSWRSTDANMHWIIRMRTVSISRYWFPRGVYHPDRK